MAVDSELLEVRAAFANADPDGQRVGAMMRRTLDQLYDGQRTGRYSWSQLHKTERTHFGTLFEINLRREFDDVIDEGRKLDYRINGVDVDCKFSQKLYGWMIPPEAIGHVLAVGFVDDNAGEFAFGLVRASPDKVRTAANRDAKVQLNPLGKESVEWIHRPGTLPPNVLLQCSAEDLDAIFSPRLSGQGRVNELLRRVQRKRIGRNTIATVAQQDDFMKRVRENGGARSLLRPEGIVIFGGDYSIQRNLATALGLPTPAPGELVSARLTPADAEWPLRIELEGSSWRVAERSIDPILPAPRVPQR